MIVKQLKIYTLKDNDVLDWFIDTQIRFGIPTKHRRQIDTTSVPLAYIYHINWITQM